jgi:hypothetical protein
LTAKLLGGFHILMCSDTTIGDLGVSETSITGGHHVELISQNSYYRKHYRERRAAVEGF